MSLLSIKDSVENYAYVVALEAYLLAMQHARELYSENKPLPSNDDLKDSLKAIVKNKLTGEKIA